MTILETSPSSNDHPAARLTTTIRPGVNFPDWSVVTSDRAGQALADILEAFGAESSWRDFAAEDDFVRRAILSAYLETGRAPAVEALSSRTELSEGAVRGVLNRLHKRDLVVMDDMGNLTGAYPLTDRKTEHRVHIEGVTMNAMCAVDALGAGRMFGRDATVESSCRATGAPIRVLTTNDGRTIESYEPAKAVVWSGAQFKNGRPAAETLCTVIAFFASKADLESWRSKEHPDIEGYCLSIDEAAQVGQAIFGPMLAEAEPE